MPVFSLVDSHPHHSLTQSALGTSCIKLYISFGWFPKYTQHCHGFVAVQTEVAHTYFGCFSTDCYAFRVLARSAVSNYETSRDTAAEQQSLDRKVSHWWIPRRVCCGGEHNIRLVDNFVARLLLV